MTTVLRRIRRVRRSAESGSVLALSLVFLMLFGVVIGVILEFAATGQRTSALVDTEGTSTYAGGGALDGAVNRLRAPANSTVGTSVGGTTTCFTMPAGELGTSADVTVTCTPRSGSGAATSDTTANTPTAAVQAVSANASEGLALSGPADVPVRGNVSVNRRVLVPAGSVLTSTGSIRATTCTVAGTVTPACTTPNTAADPGWTKPATYPPVVNLGIVTCRTPVMRLQPGTYLSLLTLQAVFNCPGTVVWFQPGLYYFDFRDTAGPAGSHELVADTGDVIVGGAAKGWDPGSATLTPGSLPDPSRGDPARSACDPDTAGVVFLFGNDSRLHVRGGKVQLCAASTSTTQQHVVVQGLTADSAALTSTSVSTATSASSATWTNPNGVVTLEDGQIASATVLRDGLDKSMQLGPLTDLGVPAEATDIVATVRVTQAVTTTAGNRRALVRLTAVAGDGSIGATVDLRDCRTITCDGTSRVDSINLPFVTAAQANGAVLTLTVNNQSNGDVTAAVDGLVVDLTFRAPLKATSGSAAAAPYVRGAATTTPVLRTSGTDAETVLALHGTVDTAAAAVDLGLQNVPYTVVDRGVLVRHLETSMTRAPSFTDGQLITLPGIGALPRRVYLVATSSGVELARAEVTLHDAAGTGNGTIADLDEWFVN